jgi:protocatechuate 3,4-dioxygenase beta subunit/membrane-associated protease RseP (regulator of RpoE activity)
MRKRLAVVVVLALAVVVALVWRSRRHDDATHADATEQHATAAATHRGPRPPAAPATLSGRVTRKADGSPIAGAVVAIERIESQLSFGRSSEAAPEVVTTDASGMWTASKVPPGDYVIAATARGFLPGSLPKLAIAAGSTRGGLDLALEPGGTVVSGTVSDIGGGPIAGARVVAVEVSIRVISGKIAPFLVLTGADGRYDLTLPDGAFELAASHDDYTGSHRTIQLHGKPLKIDFVLAPGGTIRGQVIARDTGKPVPGAIVSADTHHRRDSDLAGPTVADGDGKFAVHSLPSGAIAISAAAPGYASKTPTTVELGIGEQVEGVRVLVDHALSISGRVIDKVSKHGIEGAHVGAFSIAAAAYAQAPDPTDKDGAFEIVGVKPGSYMLVVIADDEMPDIGKPVEVEQKDVTGVVIELGVGATLSGRVEPPSRATIGLAINGEVGLGNMMDMFRTAFVHAETDATGAFVMRHVPAGKFTLIAKTLEGPAGKLPITVTDADQSNLLVMLERRASISGRVIDTNGAPVADIKVIARPTEHAPSFSVSIEGSMREGATSTDDGSFKIVGLEPGKYQVKVEDLELLFDHSDKKDPPVVVELAAGADRTGVTVTVEAKDGVIRGQVVDSEGKSVADAWVSASRQPTGDKAAKLPEYLSFSATTPVLTGADGKFTIDHLRKGSYHVVVEGPRGASRGEQGDVKTGSTVTITLGSLGTLSGHVTMRAAPVVSYDLQCHGPAGRIDRHVDAADGAYLLEHLAPGHYACDASADGGTATGEVDVPTSAATLELQLVPWGSLTGVIVSVLTGRPVAGVGTVAFDSAGADRSINNLFTGDLPSSDASGRFSIDRVANGSGELIVLSKSSMAKPLATKPYTVAQGQRVDLGTIKIIPPRTTDPGTLGMATDLEDHDLAVSLVQPGGPAASAGIVAGDKITAIDGTSVVDMTPAIAQQVLSSGTIGAGQSVTLTLARGATVSVTAGKF